MNITLIRRSLSVPFAHDKHSFKYTCVGLDRIHRQIGKTKYFALAYGAKNVQEQNDELNQYCKDKASAINKILDKHVPKHPEYDGVKVFRGMQFHSRFNPTIRLIIHKMGYVWRFATSDVYVYGNGCPSGGTHFYMYSKTECCTKDEIRPLWYVLNEFIVGNQWEYMTASHRKLLYRFLKTHPEDRIQISNIAVQRIRVYG